MKYIKYETFRRKCYKLIKAEQGVSCMKDLSISHYDALRDACKVIIWHHKDIVDLTDQFNFVYDHEFGTWCNPNMDGEGSYEALQVINKFIGMLYESIYELGNYTGKPNESLYGRGDFKGWRISK